MIDRSFNALRNRRNCSLATIDHHDVSRRLEVWQCRFDDRFEAHCGPAALGPEADRVMLPLFPSRRTARNSPAAQRSSWKARLWLMDQLTLSKNGSNWQSAMCPRESSLHADLPRTRLQAGFYYRMVCTIKKGDFDVSPRLICKRYISKLWTTQTLNFRFANPFRALLEVAVRYPSVIREGGKWLSAGRPAFSFLSLEGVISCTIPMN